MFGHVQANREALSPEQQKRYQAAYCGLCRCLGEKYGLWAKLALSYDLSFLSLLLSSLYEPEEKAGTGRCITHPVRPHNWACSESTDYAADMTVALSYHKALDDWQDEGSRIKKTYAALLRPAYINVQQKWSGQCSVIEKEIAEIARIESSEEPTRADEAANSFGRLMAELFVFKKDRWEYELRAIGYGLGRFIYLADAAVDFEKDMKSGAYNPLLTVGLEAAELRPVLKSFLGETADAFERLPLVQDAELLRNILYSGIWMKYNQAMQSETERETDDRRSI